MYCRLSASNLSIILFSSSRNSSTSASSSALAFCSSILAFSSSILASFCPFPSDKMEEIEDSELECLLLRVFLEIEGERDLE